MFAEGRTYAEIGRAFGISRQRVQQIVRPPIQVLDALKRRSGNKCERCRICLRVGDAHVHHIDREVTGGFKDLKRVRLLCRSCHKIEDNMLEPHKNIAKRADDSTLGPCRVLGCRGKGHGRFFIHGYCVKHYERVRKYGSPDDRPMGRPRKDREQAARHTWIGR
jgi:hypothetical protein